MPRPSPPLVLNERWKIWSWTSRGIAPGFRTPIAVVLAPGTHRTRTTPPRGVASRAFNAVAAEGVNIGLISAGASLVAYHFTVKRDDLEVATKAIHKEFFGC